MESFEELTQREQDQFRRVCAQLLTTCFVCKQNPKTRSDYYFIVRQKSVFEEYLGILGLSLDVNERYGVAELVSRDGLGRLRLRMIDSIILLILRILYDEKKRELGMEDMVVVNVGDIQEKYLSMNIRDKQIDKTTMSNALRTFRRYNLIGTVNSDMTQEDSPIMIYDSILMAVRVEDIQEAVKMTEQYRKGASATDEASAEDTPDQLA